MSIQDIQGEGQKRSRKTRFFGFKEAVVFGALLLLSLAYVVLMNERAPAEAIPIGG